MTQVVANEIRRNMQRVRCELGEDVSDVVDSARQATDWRIYIKRYPWLSLGAVAALGYLVVPRRVELISPDAETLLRLAKENKLVVKADPQPQPRKGALGGLFGFIVNATMRAGLAYLGQRAGKMASAAAAQPAPRREKV